MIASPLLWNSQALNGIPPAACGQIPAASFRYLSQGSSMPYNKVAGLLTDIGTEELAHLEMIAAIVRQLTKGLSA